MAILDETSTFAGGLASAARAETTGGEAQVTKIVMVGVATVFTSSSLYVETLRGMKVTRGAGTLIAVAGAPMNGLETLNFLETTFFSFCSCC